MSYDRRSMPGFESSHIAVNLAIGGDLGELLAYWADLNDGEIAEVLTIMWFARADEVGAVGIDRPTRGISHDAVNRWRRKVYKVKGVTDA